ncbi:MAG: transposase [Opitutaceae bacterium]|nr:transposase [Opitutaceae bacterium]
MGRCFDWKAALVADDVFRELLRGTIQQVLEAEMEEALGAGKWERTEARRDARSLWSKEASSRITSRK